MRPPKVDGTVVSKRLCFLVCQVAPKLQLDFRPQALAPELFRFAGAQSESRCQNRRMELKMTADNLIATTVPHYHWGNDEAAARSIASVPAISSSRRSVFQAGTSDTMRWTAIR